jgi:hypothetical protein
MMALGADLMQSASPPQPKNCGHERGLFFAFSILVYGGTGGSNRRFPDRPGGRNLLLFFSMRPARRSVGGERLGRFGFICVPSASRGRDGERVCDLKHEFASGRGGVDRLLVEVQIDAARLQGLDRAEQVDQRAPQPVYGPSHHHIEFAPSGVIEYLVQTGPPIPALSAADAVVLIDADAKPEDWQHLLEMAATWDMLAKQRPGDKLAETWALAEAIANSRNFGRRASVN